MMRHWAGVLRLLSRWPTYASIPFLINAHHSEHVQLADEWTLPQRYEATRLHCPKWLPSFVEQLWAITNNIFRTNIYILVESNDLGFCRAFTLLHSFRWELSIGIRWLRASTSTHMLLVLIYSVCSGSSSSLVYIPTETHSKLCPHVHTRSCARPADEYSISSIVAQHCSIFYVDRQR